MTTGLTTPLSFGFGGGPRTAAADSQTQAGTWFGDFNPAPQPDNTKYYLLALVGLFGVWAYVKKNQRKRRT